MMGILIAADIGGTKTRIRITDTDGNILSEIVGDGVALAVDGTDELPVLEALLSDIKDREQTCAIAINLGGKNTEQVLASFRKFFPSVPMKIFRESEGDAAYALGDKYGAPIVLMAGTGAIAVGKRENKFVTVGGWGINIGDEGSGYDVGLQAIKASLAALDGVRPLSPLVKFICGFSEPFTATDTAAEFRDKRDAVRARLYPLDRRNVASVAKTVFEFAEKGDEEALKIFDRAGEKLSELVINVSKKLSVENSSVVVTGGLINSRKFWSGSFERALKGFEIRYIEDGLLYGTYSIARELYEKEAL